MNSDDRLPDTQPPHRRRRRLAVIVAIAVATLAVVGVGASVAMRSTSVNRHALGSTPTPSPVVSAQPGTPASSSGTGAPTTIQSPGSVPALSPTSPSAAPPATPSSGLVVITEFSRDPVTVVRGTEIEIDLASANPHWKQPRASDAAVLEGLGGSTSPDGSAHALFRAVADGDTTVVAAQAPPSCSPKCLMPQRVWEITVTVTG